MQFNINNDSKYYLKALFLILIISSALGFITALQFPADASVAVKKVSENLSFIENLTPLGIFSFILLNNTLKAFMMMLLGILWGVIPVLFIILNGYAIGVVAAIVGETTGFVSILLGTIPHGIFEIYAVLLAASYGVWLGEKFAKKLKNRSISLLEHIKIAVGKFLKIVFPILIVAALVETFITRWVVDSIIF